jgi:hypothetical protein
MFNEIDKTIFPERCEVIYLDSSQQYVFPIMKNGSSSFFVQIQKGYRTDWEIITDNDITQIRQPITVFLRPPKERFISGVNTYLQHLDRDYPGLDHKTVLWFVDNYLFLNRHYCPQFFWLVNLNRYLHPTTQLRLCSMSDIDELANMNYRAEVEPPSSEFLESIKDFNWNKLDLYFYLDQVLIDHIGQTVTFSELIKNLRIKHSNLYDLIFKKTQHIIDALPKT